jgi:hypothetical protein
VLCAFPLRGHIVDFPAILPPNISSQYSNTLLCSWFSGILMTILLTEFAQYQLPYIISSWFYWNVWISDVLWDVSLATLVKIYWLWEKAKLNIETSFDEGDFCIVTFQDTLNRGCPMGMGHSLSTLSSLYVELLCRTVWPGGPAAATREAPKHGLPERVTVHILRRLGKQERTKDTEVLRGYRTLGSVLAS